MNRPELLAIVIAFMLLVLALMVAGWQARKRRQGGMARPATAPGELGATLGTFEGKYVATTAAGDPLDRIAVHGLGFRGNTEVTVAELGVLVHIDGTDPKWIPAADLRAHRKATWTIDRVVEQDGLELLEWSLGDRVVDSYFRFDDWLDFEFAVDALLERNAA
ncbi:hypothetical protein BH11ACT4_BH11ACT4_03560 [soil metagenome]